MRECRVGLDGQNVSPAAPRDTFRRIADLQECAGDAIVKLLPSSVPHHDAALEPNTVANLAFGGPKRNRLFIAATRSLYSVYVAATGAQTP